MALPAQVPGGRKGEGEARRLLLRSEAIDPAIEYPAGVVSPGEARSAWATAAVTAKPPADQTQAPRTLSQEEGVVRVLQFDSPPSAKDLKRISAEGVRLIRPIPENAWLIILPKPGERAEAATHILRALPRLRWMGPFAPEWKIDPALRGATQKGQPGSQAAPGSADSSRTVNILAVEAAPKDAIAIEIFRLGGNVIRASQLPSGIRFTAEMPDRRSIDSLAGLNSVVWIEPWHEPRRRGERAAQIAAGCLNPGGTCAIGGGQYASWLDSLGLGGDDVIVQVMDDGLSKGDASNTTGTAHIDIVGRIAGIDNATRDTLGDSGAGHGHLNASIIMGQPKSSGPLTSDSEGFRVGQGVAPRARVYATKIFRNVGPFDIGIQSFTDLVQRASRAGALISSNSWGSDTYGRYDSDSEEFDWLTRDADPDTPGYQPMTFVFAAGNAGPGFNTIGSPATAKNVIGVGASESCDLAPADGCNIGPAMADNIRDLARFSGRGPTDDGRLGPTIVAPGTHIMGAASDAIGFDGSGVCGAGGNDANLPPTDAYYPPGQTAYTFSSGTSHSTPVVAGAAILFMEYYKKKTGAFPSPALVRAALVNTAVDCAGGSDNNERVIAFVPDNLQGWGRVQVGALIEPDRPCLFIDQSEPFTQTGQIYRKLIQVSDSAKPLRVTLAWSDAPAFPGAQEALINDLDLRIVHNGDTWIGNVLINGATPPNIGEPDRVNPIECVFIENPTPGLYTLEVDAAAIQGDALHLGGEVLEQDFAVVVSNADDQSSLGFVALNRLVYNCSSLVEVAVSDADLRGAGTVKAHLASLPDGDSELVFLAEDPSGSGVFTASISTSANRPVGGNGILEAADGTILRATYFDADDGSGDPAEIIAQSLFDCVPPRIVAWAVDSVSDRSASLHITVDTPALLLLRYGDSCGSLSRSEQSIHYATDCAVEMTDLPSCSSVFFNGHIIDEAGNQTPLDSESNCLAFATLACISLFGDTLEPGPSPAWTHQAAIGTDDWAPVTHAFARSPQRAWFTADVSTVKDAFLVSPPVDLDASSHLEFWHTYSLEASPRDGWDGSVIEISTDGGLYWQDLGPHITVNPYNYRISNQYGNPLGGRHAWSGGDLEPMKPVEVDLSAFAGPARRVRWRIGCDESVPDDGWFIDDILFRTAKPCIQQTGQMFLKTDSESCTQEITVEVLDAGLSSSTSVDVIVEVLSTGGKTTIQLNEKLDPAGRFRGVVPVDWTYYPLASVAYILQAQPGDEVRVLYSDSDRGDGLTAIVRDQVRVNCLAPPPTPIRDSGWILQ